MSKEVNPQSEPSDSTPPIPKYDLDLDKIERSVSVVPQGTMSGLADAILGTKKFSEQVAGLLQAMQPQTQSLAETLKKIGDNRSVFSGLNIPDLTSYYATPSIADFDFDIPENPGHETNRKLNTVIELLTAQAEQNNRLSAPNFDEPSCSIIFGNKLIPVPRNSNQELLCKSLFKDLSKQWEWSELLEDWGDKEWSKEGWRKIYEAARSINEKVAIETGVKDFLLNSKAVTAVNPAYLGTPTG